jgi:hypothetical protein
MGQLQAGCGYSSAPGLPQSEISIKQTQDVRNAFVFQCKETVGKSFDWLKSVWLKIEENWKSSDSFKIFPCSSIFKEPHWNHRK